MIFHKYPLAETSFSFHELLQTSNTGYDVELTVFLEVEHPLVEDNMVVQRPDPQRMTAFREFDSSMLESLTTQHTQFPEI